MPLLTSAVLDQDDMLISSFVVVLAKLSERRFQFLIRSEHAIEQSQQSKGVVHIDSTSRIYRAGKPLEPIVATRFRAVARLLGLYAPKIATQPV